MRKGGNLELEWRRKDRPKTTRYMSTRKALWGVLGGGFCWQPETARRPQSKSRFPPGARRSSSVKKAQRREESRTIYARRSGPPGKKFVGRRKRSPPVKKEQEETSEIPNRRSTTSGEPLRKGGGGSHAVIKCRREKKPGGPYGKLLPSRRKKGTCLGSREKSPALDKRSMVAWKKKI